MRNLILKKVAASVATFLFTAPILAQTAKPVAPKIQTPSTKEELVTEEKPAAKAKVEETTQEAPSPAAAPAPRRLNQHSFGLGLGQTFLMGKYAKWGEDKVTMDLFYTYAASYSFDVVVNAHWSEHEDNDEIMWVRGFVGSIKSRIFEFDNFSPFILGGLGFYAPKARRSVGNDLDTSDDKIAFGWNFGGGVDLRLNDEWTVGGLGQLHAPFAVKTDDGPDVKGYYFKLLLTLAYSF